MHCHCITPALLLAGASGDEASGEVDDEAALEASGVCLDTSRSESVLVDPLRQNDHVRIMQFDNQHPICCICWHTADALVIL